MGFGQIGKCLAAAVTLGLVGCQTTAPAPVSPPSCKEHVQKSERSGYAIASTLNYSTGSYIVNLLQGEEMAMQIAFITLEDSAKTPSMIWNDTCKDESGRTFNVLVQQITLSNSGIDPNEVL